MSAEAPLTTPESSVTSVADDEVYKMTDPDEGRVTFPVKVVPGAVPTGLPPARFKLLFDVAKVRLLVMVNADVVPLTKAPPELDIVMVPVPNELFWLL